MKSVKALTFNEFTEFNTVFSGCFTEFGFSPPGDWSRDEVWICAASGTLGNCTGPLFDRSPLDGGRSNSR